MTAMFVGSFVLNVLLGGIMSYILLFIRTLQLILHIPIFNVVLPANVVLFFKTILPFAMFDVLDNDAGYDASLLMNFDEEAERLQ